jgi:hypothetical protein
MADGLFDTFVLLIVETWLYADNQRPAHIARCWGKIIAMLDQIERDVPGYSRLDLGQMRTVGALQFMKLKMKQVGTAAADLDPNFDFTVGRPALAVWYKSMARKKLFREPLVPQT